jgi:hypothetical protein
VVPAESAVNGAVNGAVDCAGAEPVHWERRVDEARSGSGHWRGRLCLSCAMPLRHCRTDLWRAESHEKPLCWRLPAVTRPHVEMRSGGVIRIRCGRGGRHRIGRGFSISLFHPLILVVSAGVRACGVWCCGWWWVWRSRGSGGAQRAGAWRSGRAPHAAHGAHITH